MRTLQSIIALSAGGWILTFSIAAAQQPQIPQPPGMRAPVRQAVTAAVDPTYRTAWAIRVTVPPKEETEVRIVSNEEAIYLLSG